MSQPELKPHDHSNLIDQLGGTAEAARLCEVSPQAVSQWRADGIPKARLMFLKAIKPELFGAKPARKPAKAAA